MYGFLTEGVGQFSTFSTFQPIRPRFIPVDQSLEEIGVARVRVQRQISGRTQILFEGPVPKSRYDIVLESLKYPVAFPQVEISYVAIGVGPRVDWSGNLPQRQIDLVISCLKGGACPGVALVPPVRWTNEVRRPRFAQSRSRGGAMTLFGLGAVGYALGGLPGAALGAAAALLKGRFDETRVG